MKKILFIVFAICSLNSFAQFDLGLDVQSRYVWRGVQLGNNSVSLQPFVEFGKGQFAIGAWGAYSIGGDNSGLQEADLYVSYSPLDFLTISITDYFFPADGTITNNYFEYGNTTGHVFEGMLSFSGVEKFPIGITVATNFAGADKDSNGDQSFSTYIEFSYEKTIDAVAIGVFAGGVVGDNGGYYLTNGSGLINLGLSAAKEIKITELWSLPVDAALIFNPDAESIFITFGFTI
ncbi:MAG: hypothetical protein QM478_06505 [Flavobacteriaceae bacterium]